MICVGSRTNGLGGMRTWSGHWRWCCYVGSRGVCLAQLLGFVVLKWPSDQHERRFVTICARFELEYERLVFVRELGIACISLNLVPRTFASCLRIASEVMAICPSRFCAEGTNSSALCFSFIVERACRALLSAVCWDLLCGVAVPIREHFGAHLESGGQPTVFCSRSVHWRFVGSRSGRVEYNSNALANRV